MKAKTVLLLPILAAVLLLAACSHPSPVGAWTAEVRYEACAGALDELTPGLSSRLDLSGLKLPLRLDLAEDNTFNLYTEQAAMDRLMQDLRVPLEDVARSSMMETYGITEDQVEARLTELGLTMDQLMDQFFEELKDLGKPLRISGTFRWEEGTLILIGSDGTESRYAAKLTDTELTIEADTADGVGFGPLLPLTFQKNS